MSLPDFLIIGAMKCGTSTLHAQLAAQPGIFMATPKEPSFFSDDAIFAKGLGWYEALFDNALAGDLKGEASTHYTKLPTYPDALPRLATVIDSPKIIYLIRNPVARAISHYMHEWTMGRMSKSVETEFDRCPELIDYGLYGMQIAPWIEEFGTERIFVSSLETMNRDPTTFLERISSFLGTPKPLVWDVELGDQNVSAERIRRLPFHELLIDNPVATAVRRGIVPKAMRDRIRRSRQMKARPSINSSFSHRLEAAFIDDYNRLAKLFPNNPDISVCYPFSI